MKIKNIVLVLMAVLLVLLHSGSVKASSIVYNCDCGGQGLSYYKLGEKIYYNSLFIHQYYSDFVRDRVMSIPKATPNYECYFVMRVQVFDDRKELYPSRIVISDSPNFVEYIDNNGNTRELNTDNYYSSYYNVFYGNYNDKYYFLDSNESLMFVDYDGSSSYDVVWAGDWHYVVESNNSLDDVVDLAIWLCGEQNDSDLPNNVTVPPTKPIKDLEAPLNVKVDGINNNMFNNKQKSLKIRWEQSNIDLSGYETHFYFKESGRTRKTIFNEWKDVSTPWLSDQKLTTAKYCNNNLKYYEYKWWTEQSKLGDYANALLYGDESGGLMCEHSAVDFMIRNEKIDDSGVQHYSNWVYVNCFNDGTYQIYEMNDDYTLDKDSDETGNIKTDSDIYDSDTIYDEKDFDSTGVGDATNFIDSMKDLISSLREFPNLFAKIFSFFPAWILALIGMLFVAVLLARLFL